MQPPSKGRCDSLSTACLAVLRPTRAQGLSAADDADKVTWLTESRT